MAGWRFREDWHSRLAAIVERDGRGWATICKAGDLKRTYLRDVLDREQEPGVEKAQKLSDALKVDITDWYLKPPDRSAGGGIGLGSDPDMTSVKGAVISRGKR